MSKTKFVRLNSQRLNQAIQDAEMNKVDFGRECAGIMVRTGHWKSVPERKQISNWVSLLCSEDPKRKTGVHPELLRWLPIILNVRAQWLTGEDNFRTNEDLAEYIDRKQKAARAAAARGSIKFKKSPVYAMIADRILQSDTVTGSNQESYVEISFKNAPSVYYAVSPETLQVIESVCADLCCSMIRNSKSYNYVRSVSGETEPLDNI